MNYRARHERFAESGETEPYYDLGSYHRPIDTPSPQAQIWFDRGLVWAYAFNHDEAIRCFERALDLDPDLAIARWGIAYSIGPNYNKAWEAFDPVDLAASLARARMELGLAAQRAGVGDRTRADRGAAGPLPHRRSRRHRRAAGRPRRLRRCDGEARRGVSRRHRRAGAGRRRVGQRHGVGAVGHHDRRTRAGLTGGRGQADPRRRAGHAGGPRTSRRAAPLPAHHGDVGHPAGRAARGRPAARPGARCGPPAAHGQPYRRAVRRLPQLGGVESDCGAS